MSKSNEAWFCALHKLLMITQVFVCQINRPCLKLCQDPEGLQLLLRYWLLVIRMTLYTEWVCPWNLAYLYFLFLYMVFQKIRNAWWLGDVKWELRKVFWASWELLERAILDDELAELQSIQKGLWEDQQIFLGISFVRFTELSIEIKVKQMIFLFPEKML